MAGNDTVLPGALTAGMLQYAIGGIEMSLRHMPDLEEAVRRKTIPKEKRQSDTEPILSSLDISFTPPVMGKTDIPKQKGDSSAEIPPVVAANPVGYYLKQLGKILHERSGKGVKAPIPVENLNELVFHSGGKIDAGMQTRLLTALTNVPQYLLAEKDPDHAEDIPDITELLALEAYVRKYEQGQRADGTGADLSDYHRGAFGQPDFVYKPGADIVRSFDPMQLPQRNDMGENMKWLNEAYAHHAGGKNTGAVCILDVSNADEAQLGYWIEIFSEKLRQITLLLGNTEKREQAEPLLLQLCNTYVVSYGQNAEKAGVSALQGIFDEARAFLLGHKELTQLEDWRQKQTEPVSIGGLFGDDFSDM